MADKIPWDTYAMQWIVFVIKFKKALLSFFKLRYCSLSSTQCNAETQGRIAGMRVPTSLLFTSKSIYAMVSISVLTTC